MPATKRKKKKRGARSGKLRIADHWNAISIIANSQANPLKAVAEFVENSIDAGAKQISIVRGKKKGAFYLKIGDDGEGISRDEQGCPIFGAWRPISAILLSGSSNRRATEEFKANSVSGSLVSGRWATT